MARGPFGQSSEVRVRLPAEVTEDLDLSLSIEATAFALERAGDYRRPARFVPACDQFVNEINQIIGEPNSDLPGHPNTVPKWDAHSKAHSGNG
jgi:hypothetical protein